MTSGDAGWSAGGSASRGSRGGNQSERDAGGYDPYYESGQGEAGTAGGHEPYRDDAQHRGGETYPGDDPYGPRDHYGAAEPFGERDGRDGYGRTERFEAPDHYGAGSRFDGEDQYGRAAPYGQAADPYAVTADPYRDGQGGAGYGDPAHGESALGEAAYSQSGYGEPGYPGTGYAEPGYGEPGYAGPGYAEPGYAEPGYAEPGYAEPGYGGSGYAEPGYGGSGYAEPGYGGSGYAEPGYGESGYGEPGYDGPGYDDRAGYGEPEAYGLGEPAGYHDGGGGYQGGEQPGQYPAGGYGASDWSAANGRGAGPGALSGPDDGYDDQDPYGRDAGRWPAGDVDDPRMGPDSGFLPSGASGGGSWDEPAHTGRHSVPAVETTGPMLDHPSRGNWEDEPEPENEWEADADERSSRFGRGSRRRGDGARDDDWPGSGRGGRHDSGDDDWAEGGSRLRRWPKRIAVISVLLVLALGLGAGASYGWDWYKARYADYPGAGSGVAVVNVPAGASASTLAPTLIQLGVIEARGPFVSAASADNPTALKPGTYRLHYHMKAALAWKALLDPKNMVQWVVAIPEGLRVSDILLRTSAVTKIPVSQFQQVLKDPAPLGLPSYANGSPEGFLWPDKYTFAPGTSPQTILKAMAGDFTTRMGTLNLPAEAQKVNLSPREVIIVASIVQAEAGSVADMGKIARVIYNRLNNQGMYLDMDSTVFYGLGTYGTSATAADLQSTSPYNTYKHLGVPPGPIDSPGLDAINAALHPTAGNWLYFITVDLKTHDTRFTNSYTQFKQWQAEAQG